jgi:hypothetical protein
MEWFFARLMNVKRDTKNPKAKLIQEKRPGSKTAKPQPMTVPAALER